MEIQGTAAQERPVPLSYSEQLVVMLAFQSSSQSGQTYGDIAKRLAECSTTEPRRQVWAKFQMDDNLKSPFTHALIQTRLFTPDVETLLGVIQDGEPATKAVIDYLGVIVHRQSLGW